MQLFNKYLTWVFPLFFVLNTNAQDVYTEFVESEFLKTVNLYSYAQGDIFKERLLNTPVTSLLNTNEHIFLEFDDLRAAFYQFKIKLIHCEVNWTQSRLLDMEFVSTINEFYLSDFQVSQNTKIPYYHYAYKLPKPKIPGNYIVQLYESDRLVMQKRFWVFNNQIDILASVKTAENPELWKTHQQLDIKLELGSYRIGIPQRELTVLVRKNQNEWKEIEFSAFRNSGRNSYTLTHFNDKYLFEAGNEFRYLDITGSFRKGQNVGAIDLGKPDFIYTIPQQLRSNLNYTESYDNDGGYVISNFDFENADLRSDYVNAVFQLNPRNIKENKQPVLFGKLTNWIDLPLNYDQDLDMYSCSLLLKNGVYDFAFGLEDLKNKEVDRGFFEGNFGLTHNTYEVFVYHTAPGQRYSSLIGYKIIK